MTRDGTPSRRAVLAGLGALATGLAGCQTDPGTATDTGTPPPTSSPTDTPTATATDIPTQSSDDTATPTDEPTPPRPDYRCDAIWNPVQRWRVPTGIRAYEPTVADGVVYFGSQDDRLRAVDADSGTVLWKREQSVGIYRRPAVAEGLVLAAGYDGVTAYGAGDGARRFTFEPPGLHASVDSEAVVAGGVAAVLVTNYAGTMEEPPENPYTRLYAVDLADGTAAWHREFEDNYGVRGLATTGDAVVLAGTNGDVAGLDPESGEFAWGPAVGGRLGGGPVVGSGVVVVRGSEFLAAVDVGTGTVRWKVEGSFHDDPAVGGDAVYCPADQDLVALDVESGETRWRAPVPGRIERGVSATDESVYCTVVADGVDRAAKLALDAETGCRRGRYETGARGLTRAAVAGDAVYFGDLQGEGAMHAVTRPPNPDG